MMFKTHLALGLLIAFVYTIFFPTKPTILFLFLVTAFSSFPDIDTNKSHIGRKIPFLSYPIKLIFGHRGFFHSIFPPLIALALSIYFKFAYLGIAFFLGYLAHLLGDSITQEGVSFLYPFKSFKLRGPIRTNSFAEFIIFITLIALDGFLLVKWF